MQLVEKHLIKKTDSRFAFIDRAAFASKNLYNAALYEIRQHFIFCGKYLNYNQMDKLMQKHETYRALPRKVSQQVLKLLNKCSNFSTRTGSRTLKRNVHTRKIRPVSSGTHDCLDTRRSVKGGISFCQGRQWATILFRQYQRNRSEMGSSNHLNLELRSG